MRKAKKFVEKHTSPNMSNSQKFRICFNYLMGYTDFKPWINPTDAEFKTQTWPYQSQSICSIIILPEAVMELQVQ